MSALKSASQHPMLPYQNMERRPRSASRAGDLSAQRAAAERAGHAGNHLLLLIRGHVLSGELRLQVGNNPSVKRICASRAGGASGQVLGGDGLGELFIVNARAIRRNGDAKPYARAAQSGS